MLFCLASGAAFGAMAVFGKLAYEQGATTGTLLAVRFTLAAALFWCVAARDARGLSRRDLAHGFALGAAGYALQAGCYFAALQRIDASLLTLLVYTFPALVAAGAVALRRERMTRARAAALSLALAGVALAGAGAGAFDPLGALLGLSAALVYSAYILVSDGIAARVLPHVLAALVCTGAAASLTVAAAALGDLRPQAVTPAGWGWLACLAVISTVGAVGLFFAGLRRAGPTRASILATVEPVVTVLGAFAVFGETLSRIQLAGGALVIGAVLACRA